MTGRDAFGELGYHLEEGVLEAQELAELRDVAESVAERVASHATREGAGPEARLADGHRIQFSSRAGIQWEWADGSQEIRLIEPADHLDPRIDALFADPRLTGPVARPRHERARSVHVEAQPQARPRGQRVPVAPGLPVLVRRRGQRRGRRRDRDRVPRRRHREQRRRASDSGLASKWLRAARPERSDALPRRPVEARCCVTGRDRGTRRVGALVRRLSRAPLVAEHERTAPPRSVAVMATCRPAAPS